MADDSHRRTPATSRRASLPLDRFLVVTVCIGVLLRLAFGLGYWTDQPLTRDEAEYLSLARSLTAGDGFVYDEPLQSGSFLPFGRAPGYPAFLALVGGGRAIAHTVPASVKIAQAFVGGLGVLLVALLAGRLAGPAAARLGAVMAAGYPPLVWIAGYALSEGVFWPVALVTAWLFDRAAHADRGRTRWALLCGLASGAGILIRPALILFLPLAALLLLRRRLGMPLAALTLGALIVVVPWTLRNYAVHGRLMIVASDGGVTFWTGNHPLAIGEGDMAANPALKLDNQRLRDGYPGLSEEEMEPIYYREAFAWIRTNPIRWIGLEFRKLFYLIVPIGPSYTLHSNLYFLTSVLSYLAALTLAVAGAWILRGRLMDAPGLWLLALSSVVMCLIFFPQERFRIPIIDPALVVLGAAALAGWPPATRMLGRVE